MKLGINVAPDANPAAIAATGAKLVRCVWRDTIPYRAWLTDLKSRGVECIFVFDSSPESLGNDEQRWVERMTTARENVSDLVRYWQAGNEPDGKGIASWTMDKARVNRLLGVARSVFPAGDYILAAPGMVTGQPSWLDGLRLDLCDWVDCHAYSKDANTPQLRDMLNGYLAYGKPLACLEYDSRAVGLSAYLRDFPGVVAATVMCWDDGQTTKEGIRLGLRQNPAAYADFVAAAKEPIVPPAPALVPGIDVSNYQSPDVSALVAQYGAKHVVVRASDESVNHRQIARQQLTTAQQAGCTVAAYIWAYFDLDPVSHVQSALRTVQGFDLATVWIDCEDGSPGTALDDWLSRAVAEVERAGYRCGIYTGTPWWRAQGDSRGFTRLPLWIANYRAAPAIDSVPLPGGWTKADAHQWTSEGVDQNVFRPAVTMPRAKPHFTEGFGRWAALEPDLIGEPLENEYGPTPGLSAQQTSNGRLLWANLNTGPALFFWGNDGSRHLWRDGWPASRLVEAL